MLRPTFDKTILGKTPKVYALWCGTKVSANGFALVLSLAMMGLLVLLMLSLSIFLQVEMQMGVQQQKQEEARQNALLAVQIALADLQKYAGPDQRITAKADLLDENATHRHWTGVWHTNPPGGSTPFETGQPRWLVSALTEFPNPSNEILANPITLVGAGSSTDNAVLADRLSINENGNPIGNYAYWVGDEGIKVNTLAREPDAYKDTSATAYADQLLRLSMAHEPRWQPLLGSGFEIQPSQQDRMFSLRQLRLLDDNLPINQFFHDLSPFSKGLLTNVADGGFKKDLTRILAPGFSGDYPNNRLLVSGAGFPDPPSWGLLRSFYNSGNDTELGTTWGNLNAPVNVRPHSFADHTHGVSPIVGMMQMNWGILYAPGAEPDQNRLQVSIMPVITLINPHNVSLAPADYRLRLVWERRVSSDFVGALLILWNPTPPVQYLDNDAVALINPGIHGSHGIVLEFPDVAFAPGEAKIFSLAGQSHYRPGTDDPLPMELGLNLINRYASMDFTPATYLTDAEIEDGEFTLRQRWGWIDTVTLSVGRVIDDVPQFRDIQLIERIIYNTSPRFAQQIDTVPIPPNSNPIPHRVYLRHSNHSPITGSDSASGARWLALYNPRARISGRDRQYSAGNHSWTAHPLYDALADQGNMFSTEHDGDLAYWGSDVNAASGQHYVPLYDLPRIPLISLGSLQHANLSSASWQPSYPFANSWASPYYEFNEEDLSYSLNRALWDNYFFSGLDEGLSAWPPPGEWRNTRLRPLSDANIDDALTWDLAAANLSVLGAFNINSTSVPAWESLLKSLQGLRVPYDDPTLATGISSDATGNDVPFPRSSFSSAAANTPWRGFRSLTPTEVGELAEAIVNEIRSRGPFRSLAQFVNRDLTAPRGSRENLAGVLQTAIDNTAINAAWASPAVPSTQQSPVNQYPEASAGSRSSAAPGYLTQADLLQVLGPVLSARTDTFRIRAYGSSLNPLTGNIQAEAWCEVVVQRVHDYVDAADAPEVFPPASAINENFGRKYKIVGFRWLQSDEI